MSWSWINHEPRRDEVKWALLVIRALRDRIEAECQIEVEFRCDAQTVPYGWCP